MSRQPPEISVIVCTHDPRAGFLEKTLAALRAQTLSKQRWELLLVDNASTPPLADRFDLSWHPNGRHLREEKLGKLHAFLLGVRESSGPVITIVDDDNLLAPDYLENAAAIAAAHSDLGAWSGNVKLSFAKEPPGWARPYLSFLAGRTITRDEMVRNLEVAEPMPVGAGGCVRRKVAEHYAKLIEHPGRPAIGRIGKGFDAGEDTDLVLTACDLGMARGVFARLHLDHLIPPERLEADYLVGMAEGIRFAGYMLELARHPGRVPPPITPWWYVCLAADSLLKFGIKRRIFLANKRAQKRAREYYETHLAKRTQPLIRADQR